MEVENNLEDELMGIWEMLFFREIYIECKDFMEDLLKKFFWMGLGCDVCLKGVYILYCEDYVKDEVMGEIKEVYCMYYLDSCFGDDIFGIKVKGIFYWVFIVYV